jgi:hypothetical protein
MTIEWIKEQVRKGNYQLKVHAIERASLRGIDPLDIKAALLGGRIIETYPNDARGESCLVYGKNEAGKSIHVVCGMGYDSLWIITVYEPDSEEWEGDVERRRKQ